MRNPKRSLRLRLWDILEAIKAARLAGDNLPVEVFSADLLRRLAAERAIEIISEASRFIPDAIKADAAHLPWSQIAGTGNVIRHGYDVVSPEIILKIIREDLAPLEEFIRPLLDELDRRE
jgi:uncharacterized protein with HEPN domain